MRLLQFFTFLGLVSPWCEVTWAETKDCGEVLAKNTNQISENHRFKLAWLNTVTNENYKERKIEGDAVVPGYFDGGYSEFSIKRQKYLSEQKYNSTQEDSKAELRVETPIRAIEAWEKCILQSQNLFVWIKDVDTTSATLGIGWKPGDGMHSETLEKVSSNIPGVAVSGSLIPGETRLKLTRKLGKAIRGTIQGVVRPGTSNQYQFAQDFYIPASQKAVYKAKLTKFNVLNAVKISAVENPSITIELTPAQTNRDITDIIERGGPNVDVEGIEISNSADVGNWEFVVEIERQQEGSAEWRSVCTARGGYVLEIRRARCAF